MSAWVGFGLTVIGLAIAIGLVMTWSSLRASKARADYERQVARAWLDARARTNTQYRAERRPPQGRGRAS